MTGRRSVRCPDQAMISLESSWRSPSEADILRIACERGSCVTEAAVQMIDLIVLVILALAAYNGWRRGALVMFLTCTGLVAGYLLAWTLYRPVGSAVARVLHLPPLLAMPIAGALVMMLVSVLFKIVTRRVEQRRRLEMRVGPEPAPADLLGGALFGALYAGSIVVVLAWAAQAATSLRHAGPDLSGSVTGRVASAVIRRATFAMVRQITGSPFIAGVLSVVASQPSDGVASVNALLQDTRVQQMLSDTLLREALTAGDAAALAASPAALALANDRQLGDAARLLGLIGPDARGPDAVAAGLVTQLTPLLKGVESAKRDPEVQRLLADPHLMDLLQRGDFGALAADSAFNALSGLVLQKVRSAR